MLLTQRVCCELWAELADILPRECRDYKWICAGDWNFMERREDKSCNNSHILTIEERRLFELLSVALNIHDPFPSSNQVKYSWDNRRGAGNCTLARLDRIYTGRELGLSIAAADYDILVDSSLSDHMPVRRKVLLEAEVKKNSPYMMNATFLHDKEVKSKLQREWKAHPSLPFFGKVRRYIRIYKQQCINQATEKRRQEDQLRRQLEEAAINLQADPSNEYWQSMLAGSMDQLQKFEKYKMEGQLLRSRIKWKQVSDQCSKEFFQATRKKSTASHIMELTDHHGLSHTSQPTLQEICQRYYGILYTTRQDSVAIGGAKRIDIPIAEPPFVRPLSSSGSKPGSHL
jgi:hypothetical protein